MFVVTLPNTGDPSKYATSALEAGANILEVRGDITPDIEPFASPIPLLVSPRGSGCTLIEKLHPVYIDLELGEECDIDRSKQKLIGSYHNYEKTPTLDELVEICDQLLADAPAILKIATHIQTYEDMNTLRLLHDTIPLEQERAFIGMGAKAYMNRLSSPLKNSLTYCYLNQGEQAAEGQIPLHLYKRIAHCNDPKLFGILGGTNIKSLSPAIHNTLFEHHNVDALYGECLTDNLEDAWRNLTKLGVVGFSVTAPWKKDIIQYIDVLEPHAEHLQSVNTAVLQGEQWHGYSTDAIGLMKGYDFWETAKNVAIVGSGGVVPTVIDACKSANIENITLYARNDTVRTELANQFSIQEQPLKALEKANADVIICTISNDVALPLPHSGNGKHALDLRYGATTVFMSDAMQKGYTVHNGLSMLEHQALAQFHLFTGIETGQADADLIHSLLT